MNSEMVDSITKESSSKTKDDDMDAISENSLTPHPHLQIQYIEGIGPTTAKKLKEAGIVSVMDLAVTSADELAVDINTSKESAGAFIIAAQNLVRDSRIIEMEFLTADVALEKRRSMLRCST
jgi:DNA repair protein RadA